MPSTLVAAARVITAVPPKVGDDIVGRAARRGDVDQHEISDRAGREDAQSHYLLQTLGNPARPQVVLGETADAGLESHDAGRCHHPGLTHRSAEHLACPPRPGHELLAPS